MILGPPLVVASLLRPHRNKNLLRDAGCFSTPLFLIDVTARTADLSLALECLPALAAGGLAMFWILERGKIPRNMEQAFK